MWRRGEKRRGDIFNKTKKNQKNKSGLFFLLFSSRKWRANETQSQPNTHHHSNLLSTTNNNLDLSTTILKPYFTRKIFHFLSFLFPNSLFSSLLFPKTTSKLSFLHERKNKIFSSLSQKKNQISRTLPNSCAFFPAIKWVYVWRAFLWLICVPSKLLPVI